MVSQRSLHTDSLHNLLTVSLHNLHTDSQRMVRSLSNPFNPR